MTSVSTVRSAGMGGLPIRSSSALRKPRSKGALCITSLASPMKAENCVCLLGEAPVLREKVAGEPVHAFGALRHVPLGVEITLEAAAGGDVIDQLHRADLDDPVTRRGFQAGGLGIEHDLTHDHPPQ